jgi:hypothetical protein
MSLPDSWSDLQYSLELTNAGYQRSHHVSRMVCVFKVSIASTHTTRARKPQIR